jgi:hypothetical protein
MYNNPLMILLYWYVEMLYYECVQYNKITLFCTFNEATRKGKMVSMSFVMLP